MVLVRKEGRAAYRYIHDKEELKTKQMLAFKSCDEFSMMYKNGKHIAVTFRMGIRCFDGFRTQ